MGWKDLCSSSCSKYLLGTRGFPADSVGTEPACDAGDTGSTAGPGRSPGGGNGSPLRSSCLETPMDRRAWWVTVHGVTESDPTEQLHHHHHHHHQGLEPSEAHQSHLREGIRILTYSYNLDSSSTPTIQLWFQGALIFLLGLPLQMGRLCMGFHEVHFQNSEKLVYRCHMSLGGGEKSGSLLDV